MTLKHKSIIFISFLLLFFFVFVKDIDAATLMLVADKQTVKIGEEINVDIKVDTEEESINAVTSIIRFPSDIFEATAIDKTGSIFSFWLEEPSFSNEEGEVKFMGGTSKGVSGKSLQIFTLKLKARGNGSGEINLSDAVVTASDGKGTNILSLVKSVTVSVGSSTAPVPSLPALGEPSAEPVTVPQIIVRTPAVAKKLPMAPAVKVPLYPDNLAWYNHLGEVIGLWDVPDDIISISALLNKNPNTVPNVAEKDLTTGKNFGKINEGIWYMHVRFKNNIGWGATSHYKISLDTTPPLPFEVKIDNPASDNPSPQITFDARDEFSGISHSLVFIDGREVSSTTATTVTLPVTGPGTHRLLVRVLDKSGSSVEDDLEYEILPLPTPIIEFISGSVSTGESVFASGTSIPSAFVDIRLLDSKQREIFTASTTSDSSGNWTITIEKILTPGKYTFTAKARDTLGALSFATLDEFFRVRPKTVLSIGRLINLGWFEIFSIVMLVLASGMGMFALWYVTRNSTREAYRIIVSRDVEKFSAILSSQLKELENKQKLSEPSYSANMSVSIGRMKETIAKMKKYINDEVNKLK